ncbi:MAG: hypothetical protein KAJ75_04300, partial [Alphaproteobacteria bacterium]|nr:hypothetical protein [Alphaproteobacteria bacterium]
TPFIMEMREWQPATNCHDDGIDAVAGCLLSEPVRLSRATFSSSRPDWRGGESMYKADDRFEV